MSRPMKQATEGVAARTSSPREGFVEALKCRLGLAPDRSRAWQLVALAAGVVLLATTLVLWPRQPVERPIVAVMEAVGEVSWNSGGRIRSGLIAGQRLSAGTVAVESETGSAEFRFADGTRMTLGGSSEAMLAATPQKRIHLKSGSLTASVTRQPEGHPMLVRTPTAEVEVKGTTFAVSTQPEETRLNVEEGNVKFRRLADGNTMNVGAKHSATASLNVQGPMQISTTAMPATGWSMPLTTHPGGGSKGEWRDADSTSPARMCSIPLVMGRKKDGSPVVHHRTSANLLKSAEEITKRTEGPASEIRERGTATQNEQLKKDMAVMDETFNRLRNSLDAPAAQRKLWLELRKAARKIVLANPDINFTELAYVTRYVTPQAGPTEGGLGNISPVAEGGIKDSGGLYQTPWPLSEKCFLVSYAYKHPESANSGIYFIDVWGNKELIHKDGILEAAYPIPLLKRPRPPVLAETTRTNEPFAVCHLSDVYQDLSGIKRGSVKWLRISERVNWVFDKTPRGELRWIPSNPFSPQFGYWTWAPVRVIGIVPVETDGSAHFKVPVGLGIYFQALDENFMEVRRMRSHIAFQPGETRACLGCHESKGQMTPSSYWQNSIAAGKPPAMPIAPPWGDCALMDYSSMIQPILDRRCVTCHGTKEAKGDLDLTAIPDAYGFSQSYRSMFGLKRGQSTPVSNGDGWYSKVFPDVKPFEDKKWYALVLENKAPGQLVSVSDRTSSPWEKKIDASISQPKQFGSHQSKLILKLLRDEKHRKDTNLTKDEWLTLVTWVDANAPYTSLFFQKFSDDGKKLPKPKRVALKLAAPWAKADINDNKSAKSILTMKGINDETR